MAALSARDRRALRLGLLLAIPALIYVFAVKPYVASVQVAKADLQTQVELERSGPPERISALMRDVSVGGANLVTDRAFEEGQILSLELPGDHVAETAAPEHAPPPTRRFLPPPRRALPATTSQSRGA